MEVQWYVGLSLGGSWIILGSFLLAQMVKNLPAMQETRV